MNILLTGAHIENKGDELMLVAVRQRLMARDPSTRLVRNRFAGTYEERARQGFYQLLWPPRLFSISGSIGYLMLKRYRKPFGIMIESEIDAVLDFAGFSYTDEWGPDNAQKMADNFVRWKRQGKKIAMLPQAFGPFTHPETIAAMKTMVDHADLVFAREPTSFEMLRGAVGDRPHVKCAPDFTNLVTGIVPADFDAATPYGCIVPNHWLVRKTTPDDRSRYFEFLSAAVAELERRRIKPLVVLHAPFQDRELVEPLEAAVGHQLEVCPYTEPELLKGVLGASRVVISSRFHALVGSLSQAVPSIGIGWTHKFERLFEEYDSPELVLRASAPRQTMVDTLSRLLDEPTRSQMVGRLRVASDRHARLSQAMWNDVEHVLSNGR